MDRLSQRVFSIRTCNRKERRLLRLLRMLPGSASPAIDAGALHEAENLNLSPLAVQVLRRLMGELITEVPALDVLAPAAGWVSNDELSILTALRLTRPGQASPTKPEINAHSATHLSLVDLLSLAGQFLKDSNVVLAARPQPCNAIDIQDIARQSLRTAQQAVITAMAIHQ